MRGATNCCCLRHVSHRSHRALWLLRGLLEVSWWPPSLVPVLHRPSCTRKIYSCHTYCIIFNGLTLQFSEGRSAPAFEVLFFFLYPSPVWFFHWTCHELFWNVLLSSFMCQFPSKNLQTADGAYICWCMLNLGFIEVIPIKLYYVASKNSSLHLSWFRCVIITGEIISTFGFMFSDLPFEWFVLLHEETVALLPSAVPVFE